MQSTSSEFTSNLEKYIKHRGLDIVFTLKNGQRVTMSGKRTIEGNEIIQYYGTEKGVIVQLQDIDSADIYAL